MTHSFYALVNFATGTNGYHTTSYHTTLLRAMRAADHFGTADDWVFRRVSDHSRSEL